MARNPCLPAFKYIVRFSKHLTTILQLLLQMVFITHSLVCYFEASQFNFLNFCPFASTEYPTDVTKFLALHRTEKLSSAKVTESSLGILKSEREKLIKDLKLKPTRFPEEVIEYVFV